MNANELKKNIPYGYGKLIAKKAGVSMVSVSRFLNGKSQSIKIELAALEVLAELNAKKRELSNEING